MRIVRVLVLTMLFLGLLAAGTPAKACEEEQSKGFKDLDQGHWASEAVTWMVREKIVVGYEDGTFRPGNLVTRAEFAKIMVLALKLPRRQVAVPSFRDLAGDNWAFPFVESAKPYLTGFRTAAGDYFKPGEPAVREDMAVALVKALGESAAAADPGSLAVFADYQQVSPNLVSYMAAAVRLGLMRGSAEGDKRWLKPQSPITRAETAQLVYNLVRSREGKAPAAGEKVTYGETPLPETPPAMMGPSVTGAVENGKLILRWQAISDSRLLGYKVVVSRSNPAPRYSEDGYLYWITDRSRTYAVIDSRDAYNGGDFGKRLQPGETYYFSVTAVYQPWERVPGNAVRLTLPQ